MNKVKISCSYCGNQLERRKSRATGNCYCDSVCQTNDQELSGENNPSWKGGKRTLYCEQCELKYEVYKHREEDSRFCSEECRYNWLSENKSGENHHQYTGYKENYGASWPKERKKSRKKYTNICQVCGKYKSNKFLPVHHIIPVSSFEDKDNAHFQSNLVQLCRSCHYKMERKNIHEQLEELNGSKYKYIFGEEIKKYDRND
jgi:hypothetical protein